MHSGRWLGCTTQHPHWEVFSSNGALAKCVHGGKHVVSPGATGDKT